MNGYFNVILGTVVALAAMGCVTTLAILGTITGGEAFGFYTALVGGGSVALGHSTGQNAAKKRDS